MITKDTTHRKDEINMEKQRRVMLKLSGEALAGEKKTGFDDIGCLVEKDRTYLLYLSQSQPLDTDFE